MRNLKYISIFVILGIFLLFTLIEHYHNNTYNALDVISPFDIVVDFNKNGEEDDNELVHILDGYDYVHKTSINNYKYLALTDYELYAFAYLVENFSKDFLQDKTVSIKNNVIYVASESYNEALLKSGYLFQNGKPVDESAYKKRLQIIDKSEFKLYNAKSNKYHCLTCKYGLMAHDYVLLSKNQIPKTAKPCKYCLDKKVHKIHKNKISDLLKIPHIKSPELTYTRGNIKVFLTDFTVKFKPDNICNTALCNELVRQINSAKYSIDIAIYGYERVPKIENAIKKAIARGVKVRLVYDIDSHDSNIYANTKEFAALIKNSVSDKSLENVPNRNVYTNYFMHNKFYIFDKTILITGSANLSRTDMSGFNSNSAIMIKSPKLASIYTEEFNQMYNAHFHNFKQPILNKENIVIDKSILSVYFSPTDSTIEKVIVPMIDNSRKYIYMPVFLITDKRLAAAIIKAKDRGVDVKIIVDATNAAGKYSKHRLFRQHGIQVKTENFAGKLHSKSIIIDDKYTVIGSMNFSKSGEHKNDENLIVIKDSSIAKFYKVFFLYLWKRINDYWLLHDASSESIYSIGSCNDGIDNDYDGLIDSADSGCKIKNSIKKH